MRKMPYGFTLLEVLIAMSILGVMLVLLFGSFAICSRSWNAGEEHIHKVEQMAMVQSFFRTRLSAAGIGTSRQENSSDVEENADLDAESQDAEIQDPNKMDEWAFFQGREQYLQFASLLPESAARGGWYLFKVGVKPNSASLFVAMTPFLPVEEQRQPEAEDLEILPDLETLAMAYWGKKEDEEQPQWHNEWINMPMLPELISINIKLRNQSAWPTLVVAPRLAPALRTNVNEEG